jgi:hypothetical protein
MRSEAHILPRRPRLPTREDFAEAKAGYASGYGVDHVVVGRWLLTWGTPGFKDFPEWLAEQDS